MKTLLYILSFIFFISCNQKNKKTDIFVYDLEATNEYLNIHLDDSTYIPLNNISYYQFDSSEYIAFVNKQTPQLIIYNISKGEIYKKIVYNTEGDNSIVGYINDFYIKNLNEIYLLSPYTTFLYKSDGNGNIINKIDFSKAQNGEPLTRVLNTLGRMELIDNKFYITQNLNRTYGSEIMEKSSISAIIDTTNNTIELTPLKYPKIISLEDLGTNAGFGYQYRRIFDGENFIYSFLYSDIIYKTSLDHKKVEKRQVKSKYIPEVKVNRLNNNDFNKILKAGCEEATYEDIIFDKYRNVYYRFACPQTEVDSKDSYLEITRYGKKLFTIVILDKDLNIIGEKLFPEFTYVPTAHLIRKDGLYISCSHFKNPNYSDNVLCFQKIKLISNL